MIKPLAPAVSGQNTRAYVMLHYAGLSLLSHPLNGASIATKPAGIKMRQPVWHPQATVTGRCGTKPFYHCHQ